MIIRLFFHPLILLLLSLIVACTPQNFQTESGVMENKVSSPSNRCDASQLTGYAHTENLIKSFLAHITISNYSDTSCEIENHIQLSLSPSVAGGEISLFESDEKSMHLNPGGYLSFDLAMQNGCSMDANVEYQIIVRSEKMNRELFIPLEDPNGNPIVGGPACDDDLTPIMLEITNIRIVTEE